MRDSLPAAQAILGGTSSHYSPKREEFISIYLVISQMAVSFALMRTKWGV